MIRTRTHHTPVMPVGLSSLSSTTITSEADLQTMAGEHGENITAVPHRLVGRLPELLSESDETLSSQLEY